MLTANLQVGYLLKSAARPETVPVCLVTIKLIQDMSRSFMNEMLLISYQAKSIPELFHTVRTFYEIRKIQNKVPDGVIAFPEDSRSLAAGITVEFRCAPCFLGPLLLR